MFSWRAHSLVLGLFCFAAVGLYGCGSSSGASPSPTPSPTLQQRTDEHLFQNFRDAAARAEAEGYRLYWLGSDLSVQGVRLVGPEVNDELSSEVPPGVTEIYYNGDLSSTTRPTAMLMLTIYSPQAWQRLLASSAFPGEYQSVSVAGVTAQLYELPDPRGQTTTIRLVADLQGTGVIAEASTLVGEGYKDLNYLTNPQALLGLLQSLQPYDQ